ncbi:VOC family protein [Zobellia galactanivorans]|uniref:VOC family protein n=1 Tax=Zobellia TaxID=112040 RepID=UPI000B533CBA|nr:MULTISPECIES: VOC family protein [Zobellia]MBU3024746.1 VOC family protein [Zobellia galactanivorans]MDO6810676.1 VOC family protein [Zobellia galactanivorans]OWW23368.1 lactoylglutathione lyase [Zobellia sp. OII3]
MKKFNPVVWFEIYVSNMERASKFYEKVLQVILEDMSAPTDASVQMKGFPSDMENYGAAGALVKMEGIKPSANGSLVYFGCEDCQVLENRATENGAEIIQTKMAIGEHGFISIIKDTEGNSVGFHSMN